MDVQVGGGVRSGETIERLLAELPFRIDIRPLGGHVAGPTMTAASNTSAVSNPSEVASTVPRNISFHGFLVARSIRTTSG